MSIPSSAKPGKHTIDLVYDDKKNGIRDAKKLHFFVEKSEDPNKDATVDALKKKYPAVALLQNGRDCEELGIKSYKGIEDTFIYSTHPVNDRNSDYVNYGMTDYFLLGTYAYHHRALFRFDLSAVPSEAKVAKAYLKIYIFKKRKTGPTVQAFEVLKDWESGRGVGMWPKGGPKKNPRVMKGEVSWLAHSHPTKWSKPGGDAPGVDRSAKPVGSAEGPPAANKTWINVELDPKLVQRWIDEGNSNRGVILIDKTEKKGYSSSFRSSQYKDAPFRPRLILAFKKKLR